MDLMDLVGELTADVAVQDVDVQAGDARLSRQKRRAKILNDKHAVYNCHHSMFYETDTLLAQSRFVYRKKPLLAPRVSRAVRVAQRAFSAVSLELFTSDNSNNEVLVNPCGVCTHGD